MATVITTPRVAETESLAGLSVIAGVILAIALAALFFTYALPRLTSAPPTPASDSTQATPGVNINTSVPLPQSQGSESAQD